MKGLLRELLTRDPTLDALVGLLSYEARVLERMLFRLSECGMLVAAGEHRHIPRAVDEIEDIEDQLSQVEVVRALLVAGLAEQWGVPEDGLDLNRIIGFATDDVARRLESARDVILRLVGQIEEIKSASKELAETRHRSVDRSIRSHASVTG